MHNSLISYAFCLSLPYPPLEKQKIAFNNENGKKKEERERKKENAQEKRW